MSINFGSDFLGLGQWNAARINERSEIMNELNKPFMQYSQMWNEKGVQKQLSIAPTPLQALFFILMGLMLYNIKENQSVLQNMIRNLADRFGDQKFEGSKEGSSPHQSILWQLLTGQGPQIPLG